MNKVERVVAYAGIGAACVFGSFLASRALETRAHAAGAAWLEGGKIATVDVLEISEKLFMSDRYKPARETMLKEKQGQIETLQAALQDLAQKIQAAGENSPESEPMRQQLQAQSQSFGQIRDMANNDLNALSTQQFSEAYRLVIDTAGAVARLQGYDFVLATRAGPPEFRSKELQGALQEVLARPVIVAPSGADITPAVLKELKLDSTPAAATPVDQKPAAPKPEEKK